MTDRQQIKDEEYDDHDDHAQERAQQQASNKKKQSKSSYNAKGSRYFQVDAGYDKRVYENDWKNIIIIILVFLAFYVCNILYWWGIVVFGTCFPDEAQWYSVALFIFSVLWIIGMLISGYYCNKKLKRWEFYLEKINDREQYLREQRQREEQKREQEMKLAQTKSQGAGSKSNNQNQY
jgi:FtsZ-interacting cell division protein ZipA